MNENIVTIENLSHRYFSTDWAVKNISFNINEHGILGLLGSNGAGKSTTMNIMCGVLNQTEGTVLIDGIDIRNDPLGAKKKIGFLPQKAPLYLDNTIDEYLTYCAHLRGVASRDVPAALERVKAKCELAHFSKRIIKNLSGGYKQRVGIASAIIHDPKLVVLDEPTVGLDPVQVVAVRKIIQDIGKDRAVIFSTHMMAEVQALCDDLKMIEQGQLVFSGSVTEFNDYIKPSSYLVSFNRQLELNTFAHLRALEGITNIDVLNNLNGTTAIRAEFDSTDAIAERIINCSIKHNWKLREITLERSSLEDVFAKITKDITTKG
jgi:ABC-2 type transport system ATP-binding protein